MESASVSGTSVTLRGRLRQGSSDKQAWAAFVDRYGPKIYVWCRHWGLQEADAEDVTQDVLTILARRLATLLGVLWLDTALDLWKRRYFRNAAQPLLRASSPFIVCHWLGFLVLRSR